MCTALPLMWQLSHSHENGRSHPSPASGYRIRRLKSISAFQSKVPHRDIFARLSASVHQNKNTHMHKCCAPCSKILNAHSIAMPTVLKLHVGGRCTNLTLLKAYIHTYIYVRMYVCVFAIFMHLCSLCFALFVFFKCSYFKCSYFKFKVPPLYQQQ